MRKIGYLFAILLAACTTPIPAVAQFVPVTNTPRAVVQGTEIGIWATYNPVLGTAILIAENRGGQWYGINSQEFVTPDVVEAAGGPTAFIISRLPNLNASLRQKFAPITDPVGMGAPRDPFTPAPPLDVQLNSALALFKIVVHPDGTATIELK